MPNSPKIYGLIGYPVKHSLSPTMHNAAFKACGINAEYRLFEVKPEDLEDFLLNPEKVIQDSHGKELWAQDIVGFNITIPHKIRAREILEKRFKPFPLDIESSVAVSGAINTVKREGGNQYYLNTDGRGFSRSLKEDLKLDPIRDIKDKNVLILGCGGAGRVIVAAIGWTDRAKEVYIYEPNREAVDSAKERFFKFSYLKEKVKFISHEEIPGVIKRCRLLVNASPVGMKEGDASPISKDFFHKDLFIYDVVYNRETQLIKDANKLGLQAKGGLGMLLYQGVWAFEVWTKEEAPVEIMRQALEKELNKSKS